jgi:hypothetical protein
MFQAKAVEKIKRAVNDVMWKNMAEPRRLQMTV